MLKKCNALQCMTTAYLMHIGPPLQAADHTVMPPQCCIEWPGTSISLLYILADSIFGMIQQQLPGVSLTLCFSWRLCSILGSFGAFSGVHFYLYLYNAYTCFENHKAFHKLIPKTFNLEIVQLKKSICMPSIIQGSWLPIQIWSSFLHLRWLFKYLKVYSNHLSSRQ